MKKFHYYKKWFPTKIWRPKAHESNQAYAAKLIFFVILIQLVYDKITLTEFAANFWDYVEKVEFSDIALFEGLSLETKEEIAEFAKKLSKWKNQYDWEEDFEEFERKVRIASFDGVIGNFELQLPQKMQNLDEKAKRNDSRNKLLHKKANVKDLDLQRNVEEGSTILHDQLDIVEYVTLKKEKMESQNDTAVNNVIPTDNPQWGNSDLVFQRDKELRDALFRKRGESHGD